MLLLEPMPFSELILPLNDDADHQTKYKKRWQNDNRRSAVSVLMEGDSGVTEIQATGDAGSSRRTNFLRVPQRQ